FDSPNPTARLILVVVFQWAVLSTTSSAQFLGAEGVLLQGEKISSEHFFQFLFDTKVGETYPIAVSTDLINWRLLTNVVESTDVAAPGAPLWVEDQEASKFPQRFYRIGLPPTPVTNMVFISPGTFTM